MSAASTNEQQLRLIGAFAELDPKPCLLGGWAEDAVLCGKASRAHGDVDLMVLRSELPRLLEQLESLGYGEWTLMAEASPKKPVYCASENTDVLIEIGVFDVDDEGPHARFETLHWDQDFRTPFRVSMPPDLLSWPETTLEGVTVKTMSPLALYQLRVGIAEVHAFGDLRPQDFKAMKALRETFFAGIPEEALMPIVHVFQTARDEPLTR